LWAGIPAAGRAKRLVGTLRDPKRFWRALPVPSVSADSPAYSDDMWRGPVWVNHNYLVIEGLYEYEFFAEARELAAKTVGAVLSGYEKEGIAAEYFDAEGKRGTSELHRKAGPGRRDPPAIGIVRDYGWTASLTLRLLAERERYAALEKAAAEEPPESDES
jgi:neutral trehalase